MAENYSLADKIEWYREVLELEPNSKIFFPLARMLASEKRVDEAVNVLEEGLSRHGEYLEARLFLIGLLHANNRAEACEKQVGKLVSRFAGYGNFWQAWAACMARDGAGDAAIALRLLAAHFINGRLSIGEVLDRGLQAMLGQGTATPAGEHDPGAASLLEERPAEPALGHEEPGHDALGHDEPGHDSLDHDAPVVAVAAGDVDAGPESVTEVVEDLPAESGQVSDVGLTAQDGQVAQDGQIEEEEQIEENWQVVQDGHVSDTDLETVIAADTAGDAPAEVQPSAEAELAEAEAAVEPQGEIAADGQADAADFAATGLFTEDVAAEAQAGFVEEIPTEAGEDARDDVQADVQADVREDASESAQADDQEWGQEEAQADAQTNVLEDDSEGAKEETQEKAQERAQEVSEIAPVEEAAELSGAALDAGTAEDVDLAGETLDGANDGTVDAAAENFAVPDAGLVDSPDDFAQALDADTGPLAEVEGDVFDPAAAMEADLSEMTEQADNGNAEDGMPENAAGPDSANAKSELPENASGLDSANGDDDLPETAGAAEDADSGPEQTDEDAASSVVQADGESAAQETGLTDGHEAENAPDLANVHEDGQEKGQEDGQDAEDGLDAADGADVQPESQQDTTNQADGQKLALEPDSADEHFSLRTRSMAEVLAEQGDLAGAIDIYSELFAASQDPTEKAGLQVRIDALADRLHNVPGSQAGAGVSPAQKTKLISMLESLAERIEAKAM